MTTTKTNLKEVIDSINKGGPWWLRDDEVTQTLKTLSIRDYETLLIETESLANRSRIIDFMPPASQGEISVIGRLYIWNPWPLTSKLLDKLPEGINDPIFMRKMMVRMYVETIYGPLRSALAGKISLSDPDSYEAVAEMYRSESLWHLRKRLLRSIPRAGAGENGPEEKRKSSTLIELYRFELKTDGNHQNRLMILNRLNSSDQELLARLEELANAEEHSVVKERFQEVLRKLRG